MGETDSLVLQPLYRYTVYPFATSKVGIYIHVHVHLYMYMYTL